MVCVVSLLVLSCSLLSSLLFSFPLRVGVRGSARAALRARTLSPNTIASSLLFVFCLSSVLFSVLFFVFLRAPPFCCWNGGGGFTMCRSAVLA